MRTHCISTLATLTFQLALLLLMALPLQAQRISKTELKIASATIHDGKASVPLASTFEFTFGLDLPKSFDKGDWKPGNDGVYKWKLPFSSRNNIAFHFEPRRLAFREEFYFGGDKYGGGSHKNG